MGRSFGSTETSPVYVRTKDDSRVVEDLSRQLSPHHDTGPLVSSCTGVNRDPCPTDVFVFSPSLGLLPSPRKALSRPLVLHTEGGFWTYSPRHGKYTVPVETLRLPWTLGRSLFLCTFIRHITYVQTPEVSGGPRYVPWGHRVNS